MTKHNYTGDDPAFSTVDNKYYGLTKREWLAGMALQGMLSNSYTGQKLHETQHDNRWDSGELEAALCRASVRTADSLLAELDKHA